MKTISFIRHGQTARNLDRVHQSHEEVLSEVGLSQAALIPSFFKSTQPQVVIVSPFIRTRQTAEPLCSALGIEPEFNELFVEARLPSIFHGKSHDDPEIGKIKRIIQEKGIDPTWRHSDEENFTDRVTRAKAALAYLEQRSEDRIAVVSHGVLIRILLWVATLDTELTPKIYWRLFNRFQPDNASVSTFEWSEAYGWKLRMWNDTRHLDKE